jgi:hypothetical protein
LVQNPERLHLIPPYERDPRKWLKKESTDEYSKARYRVTTLGEHGTRHAARVKTYGKVFEQYENHAESKCADAYGNPCQKQTTGLLHRRHIKIDLIKCIGKESNSLEAVDEGLEHSASNVYTEYADPERTEWITKIQPALTEPKLEVLVAACGKRLCRREIIELRAGRWKTVLPEIHRGKFMRLTNSAKRASERNGSNIGSTLNLGSQYSCSL